MAEQIGDLLDSLGVTHTPDDDELVAGALVLMKVIDADVDVSMRLAWSDGMGFIERIGMLRLAERVELGDTRSCEDQE